MSRTLRENYKEDGDHRRYLISILFKSIKSNGKILGTRRVMLLRKELTGLDYNLEIKMNMTIEIEKLAAALKPLGLNTWRYLPSVGSTNDLALDWAHAGAPDWAVVLADTQTAGRGRDKRVWLSRPGSLALSLILRPSHCEIEHLARFTALAGLGVVHALGEFGLQAKVKWPNDVLLAGKKVAGVLVESEWMDESLAALIIGLGVNVTKTSQPEAAQLRYPATSVEAVYGQPIDRWALLTEILRAMQKLRVRLHDQIFIQVWNQHLAFRGEEVRFYPTGGEVIDVRLLGVNAQGGLMSELLDGTDREFLSGEILMA